MLGRIPCKRTDKAPGVLVRDRVFLLLDRKVFSLNDHVQ